MEDDLWILLNLTIVLFLVLLNGFFVASEFALVKVKGTRLDELASKGNKRAKIAQHVTSRLDAYLFACQLGITLASLGLGWIGGPAIAHSIVEPLLTVIGAPEYLMSPVSFAIAFGIIIFLHIVLGVLAPKSLAIFKTEGTSLWLSGPLMVFYKMTYPVIWLLNGSANKLLSWIGIRPAADHDNGHTEEEIRLLMKESQKSGHIDENELALVENIFDFSERVAREIMVPRTMFACLYADSTFEENLRIVEEERHSRFPVVESDKDNILGLVHASDVYHAALHAEDEGDRDIRRFVRPMMMVPESMEISQVLRFMQKDRVQMVAVVDEYGGTAGLITLEDIIEEIVGDIQDELREERAEVEIVGDKTSLDARMLIQEVNALLQVQIEDDEVDTIGGWVYSQLEAAPQVGQVVALDDLIFEISEVEHLRIQRIIVRSSSESDRDIPERIPHLDNDKAIS